MIVDVVRLLLLDEERNPERKQRKIELWSQMVISKKFRVFIVQGKDS